MPYELMLALTAFAFVTSVTPGPNNLMLLASGVNFGFRRTLPHALGVTLGFMLMIFILGLGIGQLLTANAQLFLALKIVSILYMLWLAWKIAHSGPVEGNEGESAGTPMTFLQAVAFQWVNPKAWAMALTATATYTLAANYLPTLAIVCAIFGIVNLPSIALWVGGGVALRRLLQDPVKVRIFNWTMAVLLVASVAPVAVEAVGDVRMLLSA